MSFHTLNAMNQQEHSHLNPANPDHADSFPANFEQRRYLHEADGFEQRAVWNSSFSSCWQPSKHHGRLGEPLYRSLLKPHHCSQPQSFVEHIEGVHHHQHKHYLFDTESFAAGNCFSPQLVSYNPCRCGSLVQHESNTRIGSKGQSHYPDRPVPNEITLYSWYLIRSGDSHTSDIAIGGFLSSRCTEVDRIETTTIVKRLEECKLLTKDGDVINLMGPIDDYRTVSNGFTLQTAHLFISGFPHIWNLLVGMGLSAKVAGTMTSSQSCDFHGGETTFQERFQKETLGQRGHMEHFSAFKGLEADLVSYPEGERSCVAQYATNALCEEVNEEIPESVVQLDQDIALLNGECQSKEDPFVLHSSVQEKESDKKGETEGNCVQQTDHEGSHGQKSKINVPAEGAHRACELDNMCIESMEAAVSEIAFGSKEPEAVTEKKIKNHLREKNHAAEVFVEVSAEADKVCNGNYELAAVQPFQMRQGELGITMLSNNLIDSSPKRKTVAFSSLNHVEGGDLSSACLSLENSAEKSCSFFSQNGEELISAALSGDKQEGVVTKKAIAKKKGKHKRRVRILLARSKRASKPMVDFKKSTDAVKQPKDSSHEEQPDRGFKKRRRRELREGQVAAVAEADLPTGKTAEQISDPILVIRTREASLQKFNAKKGVQTRSIAKEEGKHFSKLRDSISRTRLKNLAEATDLACKLDNMPIEIVEGAVAFGNKESEVTKNEIENGAQERSHADETFVDATTDGGTEADNVCSGNIDLATLHPFQMSEGKRGLSKTSSKSSPKKRKVSFSSAKDVEGGDLFYLNPNLENSEGSMEKSCSLFSQKEGGLISSVISITKRKGVEGKKTATSKKKGKHKRRGRILLRRSRRTTKPMVQVDFKKRANAVRQPTDASHEEQLDRGFKKRKTRKLREGQVAAVAEEEVPTGEQSEQVSDPILVIRTRKASLQAFNAKKGVQIKPIAKKDGDGFAKSQYSMSQTSLTNPSEKLEIMEFKDSSFAADGSKEDCRFHSHDGNAQPLMASARKRIKKMLPPPLPSPLVSVSKQLVSKAFGLKTSKSGRLLVPPLAHWRGQSLVRDMDGGIIGIEDGSNGTPLETGCFNFKPPIEARAKKLQEWLSETASKCLTKKLNARRKGNQTKGVPK